MARRSHDIILALGILFGVGIAPPALAEEPARVCPVCAAANDSSANYPTKAGSTFVRGATNTLLGWTELIKQPAREAKAGGSVFTGIAKGLGQGLQRTAGGIAEVLTFWTPKMNNEYLQFTKNCPVCAGKTAASTR